MCYAFVGHGFSGSHRRTPQAYTTFLRAFTDVSCLNHIPGFSPEGVSISTCFTYLHTYFSCHEIVSLNLDVVPFYRAHHRTPNTVSINHVLTTYIEHQHSVDLPCSHDIHRTPNTVSVYHVLTTYIKHQTQCRFTILSNTKHSVDPNHALTPDST